MPARNLHLRIGAAILLVLAGTIPQVVQADGPLRPDLSPTLRRILAWLPENTETIVVGQSFTIPQPEAEVAVEPTSRQFGQSFQALMPRLALGALLEPEIEMYLKPLAGKKIVLALRGGRNYELVSASLPTFRTAGCAVVIFENELGEAGREWVNVLRTGAQEVRRMTSRDVFVFPPTKSMRVARESKWPGQPGVYLAVLDSRTILCATSDKYLEQLLERIDKPSSRRALPDNLREWIHVDPAATSWMLRHNSIPGDGLVIIEGVTWTLTKNQLQAVYVLATGAEERAARVVEATWNPALHDVRPRIERHKNGSIVVLSDLDNLSSEAAFGLGMELHWLEAQASNP